MATDCALLQLAKLHHDHRREMPAVLPGYNYTIVPWSSVLLSWDSHMSGNKLQGNDSCSLDRDRRLVANRDVSISDLTLQPAPGEVFKLHVRALDEMHNYRPGVFHFSVRACLSIATPFRNASHANTHDSCYELGASTIIF